MKSKEYFLLLGAVIGIALAAYGSISSGDEQLPEGAVAVVNGAFISEKEYLAAIAQAAKSQNLPASQLDKNSILDQLIIDELMLTRAVELGLVESDAAVRATIISALSEFIISKNEDVVPSESELHNFYLENLSRYTPPQKYETRTVFIPKEQAESVLNAPVENVDALIAAGGKIEESKSPRKAMPLGMLRRFLGRAASQELPHMNKGQIAGPYEEKDGYLYVELIDKPEQKAQAFSDVKALISIDYTRFKGDQSIALYADKLKQEAVITVREVP